MYKHLSEYAESLVILGGRRWLEVAVGIHFLTATDKKIVRWIQAGHGHSDESLARELFGPKAKVDAKYRRRVSRITHRLSRVVLACTLSSTMDERRRTSINCVRELCIGEALLRTAPGKAARRHFTEALQHIVYPELVWYAPPIYLSFAYYDAVNNRRPATRQSLANARAASEAAMSVFELQEMWVLLTIPVRRKVDREALPALIKQARLLLDKTSRKPITGIIGIAAARLANVIAQRSSDSKIGLGWLEHSRKALLKEGLFNETVQREYHQQRLFLFSDVNDYVHAVNEARRVIALTIENSAAWFSAYYLLLELQLRSGRYSAARKTSDLLLSRRDLRKQPVAILGRLRVRCTYAQVLTSDTNVTVRALSSIKRYPLDVIMIRILIARLHHRRAQLDEAVQSLVRHIERHVERRRDRSLLLLTKLLTSFSQHGCELRDCRKLALFRKYETELTASLMEPAESPVISPLNIWKAVIGANVRHIANS